MSRPMRILQMGLGRIPDDFDFGDTKSLDEVNDLLRYYQVYSSAVPLERRRCIVMKWAEEQRDAKKRRKPNAYRCAREGCPVQATSQAALKRCGGPCPEEYKPYYCSKECQLQDRTIHKTGKAHLTSSMQTIMATRPA
ncbi:hypothetical protein DAEQUDRAFT_133399 [Daedalea quercina L-15889]|uniref:Uncharacterized protein n=1 Tax=Daedalea quercina L-15889 TaxID=1314783 RepID=A0A165KPK4_9APHY|nr:hypothetical protein DAEQUDRAFT_133399 [Daedalea quercina L-15889]